MVGGGGGGFGRGFGRGRGGGFGFGRGYGRGFGWGAQAVSPVPPLPPQPVGAADYGWFSAPVAPTREQELAALRAQAEHFSEGMNQIQKRIEELEKDSDV